MTTTIGSTHHTAESINTLAEWTRRGILGATGSIQNLKPKSSFIIVKPGTPVCEISIH